LNTPIALLQFFLGAWLGLGTADRFVGVYGLIGLFFMLFGFGLRERWGVCLGGGWEGRRRKG
jgi:hypothetical protein